MSDIPIPASEIVTTPAVSVCTYDRWGLSSIALITDTLTGKIRADLIVQRSGQGLTDWSPDPTHRINFVSSDLVAEIVSLNDNEAIELLLGVQTGILALTRKLMVSRELL